jgi:3'(2'), 5'-bisphosphate nucleotidase
MNQFPEHIQLAIKASIAAAKEIQKIYVQDFDIIIKSDKSPLTQADLNSSKVILEILKPTNIPIIGEESTILSHEERKNWETCWIVDPLDGTKEFIQKNDEFAICIALVEKDIPTIGLITSPVEQKIWLGGKTIGFYEIDFQDELKITEIQPNKNKKQIPIVLVSRNHPSKLTNNYLNDLTQKYGELTFVKKGSALKFIDLALGKAHFYPRFAPTMEWDIAAGQAILETVGGEVNDATTGKPLTYNKAILKNPYFVAQNF